MDYEGLITNWLLALVAALLAVEVLGTTSRGDAFLPLLSPIANVLAVVTFLTFVIVTGAFFVYTMSFRD